MQVAVDSDRCAGHGVCFGLCPQVFDLGDDGFAVVVVDDVPPEHEEAVRNAVRQCPERAISISGDAS
jgi:ferredoxin